MFNVDDMVVYNAEGVCRVESIGPLHFSSVRKEEMYYSLRPIAGEGRIYVPVDTQLPLRRMLTRDEALALIRRMPAIKTEVSCVNNKRVLEEHYRKLMNPHTPEALVRTVKSIYQKRHSGGKVRALGTTEEYYRKRAEGLLHQELGEALGIPADEVETFIIHTIEAGD